MKSRDRLNKVHLFLDKEVQILELGDKIQSQVKEDIDKTQREYYLREQMKAIKKELGEIDEHSAELKELREKIENAGMPQRRARSLKRSWTDFPRCLLPRRNTRWPEPTSIGW